MSEETPPLADAALADAASDICAKLPRALGISLARRPARQKAFVARAAEARVPLELCDAVDSRAMDRLPAGVALAAANPTLIVRLDGSKTIESKTPVSVCR